LSQAVDEIRLAIAVIVYRLQGSEKITVSIKCPNHRPNIIHTSNTRVTGTSKTAYDNALKAGIKQINSYGGTLTDADAAAYLAANPYPVTGTLDAKMDAIHTEFWMSTASLLQHIESWANWRRTGYPKLTPVNYPGNETNGQIPRRLRYSQGEYGVNPGIDAANARQGADLFTTRMWWDK